MSKRHFSVVLTILSPHLVSRDYFSARILVNRVCGNACWCMGNLWDTEPLRRRSKELVYNYFKRSRHACNSFVYGHSKKETLTSRSQFQVMHDPYARRSISLSINVTISFFFFLFLLGKNDLDTFLEWVETS